MGTDTEYVECFYCSNKPDFVEFSDCSLKEDCVAGKSLSEPALIKSAEAIVNNYGNEPSKFK